MSVLLGWIIYTAIAAAVILGIPWIAVKVDPHGFKSYWEAVTFLLKVLAVLIAILVVLFLVVHLGMWAGDLVSGRATF